MHAGLTPADRKQLEELQPAIEQLTKELAEARKARNKVIALYRGGTVNKNELQPNAVTCKQLLARALDRRLPWCYELMLYMCQPCL